MGKCIEVQLDTSIGKVNVVSWGNDFVVQDIYADGRPAGVTINRVLYTVRLDASREPFTEDEVWSTQHFYISRLNGYKYEDATWAARSKGKAVLLAALIAYCREHPEFIDTGNLERLEREIADKRADIARAEIVVTKLRTELDLLLQEFATSTKQPLFTVYHDTREEG